MFSPWPQSQNVNTEDNNYGLAETKPYKASAVKPN